MRLSNMKRVKFSVALLLICFQYGVFSVPISEDGKDEGYEVTRYNYKGLIDTKPSVLNASIARWTISGDLYTYNYPDFFYVKLDNVKTSIFNGPKSDLKNVKENIIPVESEIIQQMFAAKIEKNLSVTLHFKENEPLWSINMKKALYNFIDFEYELIDEEDGRILPVAIPERDINEKSLRGNCAFHVSQNGLMVVKTMSGWNCTDMPIHHKKNYQKSPAIKDLYDVLDYQYGKVLTLEKRGQQYLAHKSVLRSKTEYRTSPSAPYTQVIEQEQSYEVSEVFVSTEKIDASEFTVQTDLIYEISDDRTSGRRVQEKNPTKLINRFLFHYEQFSKRFNYSTPEQYNIRTDDIFDMYQILKLLDLDGFKYFETTILGRKKDTNLEYTYFSLIPYVGTAASVEYLTNFMKSKKINNNLGFAQKIFATLPRYIKDPTDEMLVKMEPLINHESARFKSLKNSALLSFASTVGHACQKGRISKKIKTKYVQMFHNDFLEHEDYEDRMAKLTGLINMVSCFDHELINSITTNTSESSHLRALALVGFKDYLKDYSQVYETYWPLVQKESEPFEVRVRALDLLLSSNLTEDQFNSIVSKYNDELMNDPEDKQLANYVLSALHSLKNTTGYSDYLGKYALKAIKNNKIPIHPKIMATGYYRLAYTDSALNTGSLFDVRIITNPKTNILDTIQITFNNFAHSVDFGTYTLYFKFNGFFDWAVFKTMLRKTSEVSSVPELLKLLKEHNFKLKSPENNIHVEIVFFIDNKVVFTRHYSKFEPEDVRGFGAEFIDLPSAFKYVTFPILEYAHIPSDFGTPIHIHNYLEDVTISEIKEEISYRSSWRFETWFDIYNPVADTTTSCFKYYVNEKNILVDFTAVKFFPPTFKWLNKKDSYTKHWDHMMGTMVEEDAVKLYCPNCAAYSEFDTDYDSSFTTEYSQIGFHIDVDTSSHHMLTNDIFSEFLENNLHQYNIDAFPYTGPFMYLLDISVYKYWLRSELSRGSIKSYSFNGHNKTTETYCQFSFNQPDSKDFGISLIYSGHLLTNVKNVEDNEVLNSVNMTAKLIWDTDYQDPANETGAHKVARFLDYSLKYNTTDSKDSLNIHGYGEMIYPDRRSDILSLLPFESITGETKFSIKRSSSNEHFMPTYYTFKEVYSSNSIEDNLKQENFKKDYEKCSADSKGLKYTAPTTECKKISSQITEYDNFKLYLNVESYNEIHSETLLDINDPIFECSRSDENAIVVKMIPDMFFSKQFFKFNSYKIYHPEPIEDPAIYAYNKFDTGIFPDAYSTCTITPSTVELFSGKYIPNQNKEWLAFIECYNASTTALKGRNIDDKHVGFTLYSLNNILEATVKDDEAHIILNGKHISEYYLADDMSIRIYFLDEDVVYITVKDVEIYYNTEYVRVRVNSLYPNLLCGVCAQ